MISFASSYKCGFRLEVPVWYDVKEGELHAAGCTLGIAIKEDIRQAVARQTVKKRGRPSSCPLHSEPNRISLSFRLMTCMFSFGVPTQANVQKGLGLKQPGGNSRNNLNKFVCWMATLLLLVVFVWFCCFVLFGSCSERERTGL